MRIIHTSDWHLGRQLYSRSLEKLQREFLAALTDYIERYDVELLLVSGDLFDSSVPSLEALGLAREALAKLTSLTQVVITSGNHDSAERTGLFAPYLRGRLRVLMGPEALATPVDYTARDGQLVRVWGVPYLAPDEWRHRLSTTDSPLARSHQAVLAAALRKQAKWALSHPRPQRAFEVIMAHAFVLSTPAASEKTGQSEIEESDSERDLRVGTLPYVAADTFATWGEANPAPAPAHYIALGHLHKAQRVKVPSAPAMIARYSGSPVPFSFSELTVPKSVVLLDTAKWGTQEACQLLPIPCSQQLMRIEDSEEELLNSPRYDGLEDAWVEVRVRGLARDPLLAAKLSRRFQMLHFDARYPGLDVLEASADALFSGQGEAEPNPLSPYAEFKANLERFFSHFDGELTPDELELIARISEQTWEDQA